MSKCIAIILCLNLTTILAASTPDWYLKRVTSNIFFWKSNKWQDGYLVVERKQNDHPIDLAYYQSTKYIQDLEVSKKKALRYMGVKEWNPVAYQARPENSGVQVLITGTYVTNNNQLVHFQEKHFYNRGSFVQSLLTSSDSKMFQDKNIDQVVNNAIAYLDLASE